MAMNEASLAMEIVTQLAAQGFIPTPQSTKMSEAIAKAVVKHIQANAEVVGGVCTPAGPIAGGKVV